MKKNSGGKEREGAELRRRAEERAGKSPDDSQRLVHELQVHQIELEMQNEELLRARAEVEEGLARYTDLYDFAPVGYLTLDRDGTIRQVNLTGAGLLGVERSKVVGKRFGPLAVAERQRAAFDTFLAEVFEGRGKEIREIEIRRKDAQPLTAELTGSVSETGRECRVVVTDITGRKRAERERERLLASLAHAERMASMGALAAGVAHEINNPLAYTLYNIESLAADLTKLAESMQRCHAALTARVGAEGVALALGAEYEIFRPMVIEDAVNRLHEALDGALRIKKITRSLGTFSRVERTEVMPVNVHASIDHALTLATNEIKYRACVVRDFTAVPAVLATEGKLTQVLLNLFINAAHAIDEGFAETNEIRARTWAEGDRVCIEVSDTGKGIAPEHQPKVFEPFFTTKDVGVGSGLGLSICKNIVGGFGGEISFTSELGKGTRFRIWLPRMPRDWGTPPASAEEPIQGTPAVRGRILVVDDEAGIRAMFLRILGRDHEVITASSGEEARTLLMTDRRFQVIFCDLMMPELSGMELHKWLAERDPDLSEQVVFISGGAFTPGAVQYLADVKNLRIEKPFDTASLKRLASELVLAQRSKSKG